MDFENSIVKAYLVLDEQLFGQVIKPFVKITATVLLDGLFDS